MRAVTQATVLVTYLLLCCLFCVVQPTKRLGVVNGGARLIKEHAWFADFDWEAFTARRMPAPIVLPVSSADDLSNFEEYPLDAEEPPEHYVPDAKITGWDADF